MGLPNGGARSCTWQSSRRRPCRRRPSAHISAASARSTQPPQVFRHLSARAVVRGPHPVHSVELHVIALGLGWPLVGDLVGFSTRQFESHGTTNSSQASPILRREAGDGRGCVGEHAGQNAGLGPARGPSFAVGRGRRLPERTDPPPGSSRRRRKNRGSRTRRPVSHRSRSASDPKAAIGAAPRTRVATTGMAAAHSPRFFGDHARLQESESLATLKPSGSESPNRPEPRVEPRACRRNGSRSPRPPSAFRVSTGP